MIARRAIVVLADHDYLGTVEGVVIDEDPCEESGWTEVRWDGGMGRSLLRTAELKEIPARREP